MSWFIALLFILSFVFWLLPWRTDDLLVAWCRFGAAVVFAAAGIVLSLIEFIGWLLA